MGAIQQAVNAGLATAAVAVGGAKAIAQQKKENEIEEQKLAQEAAVKVPELEESIAADKEEVAKNKAIVKAVKKQGIRADTAEYDPVDKTVTGQIDIYGDTKRQAYDIKKLKMANKTLKANIAAKVAQRDLYRRALKGEK